MANKKLKNIIIIGTVATTAFVAGSYYNKFSNLPTFKLANKPGLPIFGTVAVANSDNYYQIYESGNFPEMLKESAGYSQCHENISSQGKTQPWFSLFQTVNAAYPVPSDEKELAYTPNVLSESEKEGRIAEIMKYGFPGMDNIRPFKNFIVSYDRRNRVAHWVFEHLTADSIKEKDGVDRSKCVFKPDEAIHPLFRADNTDYRKSGYDRGHLAAAGNHKSEQEHITETFYLSNIAPQVGKGFNRDSWNRLEKYVRKLTKFYTNVYCCTGPIYLPRREADGKLYVKYEVIGKNHVAVPTHFFKVIVGETKDGRFEMESYVMGNEPINNEIPLEHFQVPPNTIEKAAGLLFFDNISRNKLSKINGRLSED